MHVFLKYRNIGNDIPLFLFGRANSDAVYEFNESPFNREHFKYSRLLSFEHNNEEFKVGDFICVKKKEDKVFQILAIGYQKNDKLHPDLCFSASEFTRAASFYTYHRRYKKPSRIGVNEYIQEEGKIILKPKHIERSTTIFPYTGKQNDSEMGNFCRYSVREGILVNYKPIHVRFCDEFVEKGDPFFKKY